MMKTLQKILIYSNTLFKMFAPPPQDQILNMPLGGAWATQATNTWLKISVTLGSKCYDP